MREGEEKKRFEAVSHQNQSSTSHFVFFARLCVIVILEVRIFVFSWQALLTSTYLASFCMLGCCCSSPLSPSHSLPSGLLLYRHTYLFNQPLKQADLLPLTLSSARRGENTP